MDAAEADADHLLETDDGWYCTVCGLPVNGYPEDRERGDNVHHTDP